jgi:uncharacterized protein YlxP (DUF503 family)
MVVGVSRIEIFFPEAHSLKDKRQMIKKIVEKTRAKFNVSMVEIADNNLWQKGRVGFAVMGVHKDHVQVAIENIQKYIESLYAGEIIDSWTEIIVMGNEI